MDQLIIDQEFSALIPPLTSEERLVLDSSIKTEGCRDALVVWDNIIIDGHNRYEICKANDIEFKTSKQLFDNRADVKIWIIQNQFGRRNLNAYQRGKLALVLKPLIAMKAKKQQGTRTDIPQNSAKSLTPIQTREEVAKSARVSHDTIAKIEKIEKKATDEQKEKLTKSEISINAVYIDIKKKERREERKQDLLNLSKQPAIELKSLGKFPVLYADPPWRYEHSKTDNRKIENQYPTMTLDEIKLLEINEITTADCILFLWATSPKLTEAISVIESWDFNYRTCMVWIKDKIGMGYYARQRHELLLIATKGKMITPEPASRPDSVIEAPRQQHSKKPEIVYELIEKMYPDLPKLELFARQQT